jgi:hypothetical protein
VLEEALAFRVLCCVVDKVVFVELHAHNFPLFKRRVEEKALQQCLTRPVLFCRELAEACDAKFTSILVRDRLNVVNPANRPQ